MFWPDNVTQVRDTSTTSWNSNYTGSPTAGTTGIITVGWTIYITPVTSNYHYTPIVFKSVPKNWRWFDAFRGPAPVPGMVAPCALLAAPAWRVSRLLDRLHARRTKRRRWQHATLAA